MEFVTVHAYTKARSTCDTGVISHFKPMEFVTTKAYTKARSTCDTSVISHFKPMEFVTVHAYTKARSTYDAIQLYPLALRISRTFPWLVILQTDGLTGLMSRLFHLDN